MTLRRATKLKNDEDWVDRNDLSFGKTTPQALAEQSLLEGIIYV